MWYMRSAHNMRYIFAQAPFAFKDLILKNMRRRLQQKIRAACPQKLIQMPPRSGPTLPVFKAGASMAQGRDQGQDQGHNRRTVQAERQDQVQQGRARTVRSLRTAAEARRSAPAMI